MALAAGDWTGRLRCSYKRATVVLCSFNILVALFMLHAALSPASDDSSAPSTGGVGVASDGLDGLFVPTEEEMERINDSNRLRRELLPVHLIERVKEIQEETELAINRTAALNLARQEVAVELAIRLRELKLNNGQAAQKGGETKPVAGRLQVLGNETPEDVKKSTGESTRKVDNEHEITRAREIPSECNAEAHTDYSGKPVRLGFTHLVNSAADCCQACLDHAKNATQGQKKCNIWVYCPSEGGCHSPDKFTHGNRECWLKQADDPQFTFKERYDEEYRQHHPTAPSMVPWISGVVS